MCYRLTEGVEHGFALYDLSDRVRIRGWQIASYPLPPNRQDTVVQRIVVRHGVSRDLAVLLLEEITRSLDHLRANPVPRSTAGPSFSHN